MAKRIKVEKVNKKGNKKKVLVVFIILVLLVLGGFLCWKFVFSNDDPKTIVEIKELDNLVEYKYSLTDKDSKYFKSEFEVLKNILKENPVDEEKYATQVAKMFVIDLYTLNTKVNKYDVGGIEYFYENKKGMFSQKVIDTLYSSMLDDTFGDREQVLPEVKEVKILSTEKTKYKLDEVEKDVYLVKVNIIYENEMGYDDEASIVVCKEEGVRLGVVDFQPTLNPVYK